MKVVGLASTPPNAAARGGCGRSDLQRVRPDAPYVRPRVADAPHQKAMLGRRESLAALVAVWACPSPPALATLADPNARPRGMMNEKALIPSDFYYLYNVVPPRVFDPSVVATQPRWNAFGSCIENSCTYVPLQQRYDGYAKYAERIAYGLRAYAAIRPAIERADWEAAASAVDRGGGGVPPAAAADALLKAALCANLLLVSPNNAREVQEASLARFYVNEASHALDLIASAVAARDEDGAFAAWEFGRDSWNSWGAVVNRAIVEKVGDKFAPIA